MGLWDEAVDVDEGSATDRIASCWTLGCLLSCGVLV
jgi:hypothetical protein